MLKEKDILNDTYRIEKQIGSGGGGIIFKAYHMRMRNDVAIKLIKENMKNRLHIRSEVDVLKKLKNDYLPQVYDFVEDGDDVYTVMEFIEGQNFKQLINRGRVFPEEKVKKYALQLCDAVSYLHSHNPPIIHSDIKPANLMLTPEDKICLIDFNISMVTNNGAAMAIGGSSSFGAPEQFRKIIGTPSEVDDFHEETRFMEEGETELLVEEPINRSDSWKAEDISRAYIDIRTDIYGMGATIYYILTGRLPTDGRLDFRGIKCSVALQDAIRKSMNPDPDKRFRNVAEFRTALESGISKKKIISVVSAAAVAALVLTVGLIMGNGNDIASTDAPVTEQVIASVISSENGSEEEELSVETEDTLQTTLSEVTEKSETTTVPETTRKSETTTVSEMTEESEITTVPETTDISETTTVPVTAEQSVTTAVPTMTTMPVTTTTKLIETTKPVVTTKPQTTTRPAVTTVAEHKKNEKHVIIAGMTIRTDVTRLDLSKKKVIGDLDKIAKLTRLKELHLSDCKITDTGFLSGLTELTELYLDNNPLENINGLSNLTKLKKLDISKCNLSNINALAQLTELTELNLRQNEVDIGVLARLKNLSVLDMFGCGISDIKAIAGLTKLTKLVLGNNKISDISPLSGLTELTELSLAAPDQYYSINKFTDMTPLSNLKKLTKLNLSFCTKAVYDESIFLSLPNLKELYIAGCLITPKEVNDLIDKLPNCHIDTTC